MNTLWEIGHIMGLQAQERAATYAQAVEAAPNAGDGGNQANPGQAQPTGIRQMPHLVEQFIKLKPPKFHGRGDPETAPRWVEELEKTFKVLECTDEEKVTLAVYQLQDGANDWWNATEGRVFPEGMAPTWAGQMTVDQYEAEFARLAKFAPTMVENLRDRARRFRDGLNPDLRSLVLSHDIKDYGEMHRRAQIMERDQQERAAASRSRFAQNRDNRRLGKRPMTGNRRFVPPARRNLGKPSPQLSRYGACFKCGSMEHQIRSCSQLQPSGPPRLPPSRIGNQARLPSPANQGRPPA
ncbi:uncharacterized protein LOC115666072 [Syzygium oleosum]|uniref:uncharacterized protein LOC115666072 n=1 Tax=Syzygium oleosum TaxID=219896 RepID=UPI0011D1B352|nr:uncharacterized protein LOC115666072 [Syzygium oleosum]